MKKIAFVTCRDVPELNADDALVIPFLAERNTEVVPAVWDDPGVPWDRFEAMIIRSCWDYHLKENDFRRWMDDCKTSERMVWNPVEILSWNLTKLYLRDLERGGISIPETIWLEQGATVELAKLVRGSGWKQAVLKPLVSATAYRTWRIDRDSAETHQNRLEEILQNGGAMVQEYLPEVVDPGEWSVQFFDRRYSHAVIKRPREGDFRVQRHFGGTTVSKTPSPELIRQAQAVVEKVASPLLYARVDGIVRGGKFYLLELELIEPILFLSQEPSAPESFARVIEKFLEYSRKEITA